jgi:predicted ArsR family transcriptional regulator
MSPTKGSIHRKPRSDSGAARLWQWARERRGPWTCAEAAEACEISPRRCRAIVAALHAGGVLDCERESETVGGVGNTPAEWSLSAEGRALAMAPVMVVDGRSGLITGIRAAG